MNNITMHSIYLVTIHVSREDFFIRLNTFALYGHIDCTIEPEPCIDRTIKPETQTKRSEISQLSQRNS